MEVETEVLDTKKSQDSGNIEMLRDNVYSYNFTKFEEI